MEFAELFTESARRILPAVHAKGLSSYFDYHGPHVDVLIDDTRTRSAMHRLLLALMDVVDKGIVMFTADVERVVRERCTVTVHAAAVGRPAPDDTVSRVLGRLRLAEAAEEAAGASGKARRAVGTCPVTGAAVSFFSRDGEGLVLTWRTSHAVLCAEEADAELDAAGAAAWIVCPAPDALSLIQGRLGRLGWAISEFASLEDVEAQLAEGGSPMLLLVDEAAGVDLSRLEALTQRLPATWIVLAVRAGAAVVKQRGSSPVDIRLLPLSPADLESFTRHVDHNTSTAESRSSAPVPFYAQSRRRVLVVDDNVVNQLVARGLLEALGYEVEVASNGAQAVAHCRRAPPDLVVMDINMPVLDGIEATVQLRELQCAGLVPPFPIIAATAGHSIHNRHKCLDAGMDGYLEKPLSFQSLEDEVLRVLPSQPVHQGGVAPL